MDTARPACRFLPVRRHDVVEMCAGDGPQEPDQVGAFRDICQILEAILHFEYHDRLEALKDAYAPIDPDSDTRVVHVANAAERAECQHRFLAELRSLLDAANFEEITEADLNWAFANESLLDVHLAVDFGAFEDVLLYQRGESMREVTRRRLGGLRRQPLRFRNYDRVIVCVRFRDASHFPRPEEVPFEPGSTLLKLFRDVPRPDLEMLLPNSAVRMRNVDKVLLGVPAVLGGAAIVATKLVTSMGLLIALFGVWLGLSDRSVKLDQAELVALGVGLGSVGGYTARQLSKFKSRKIGFMKTLAENLYFKNLDNGAGVFFNLLDAAEEEEHKEAVVAYWYLLTHGPRTRDALDRGIEAWFAERWTCRVDFDADDALGKLDRLGLARSTDDRWQAVDLDEAKRHLDEMWDGYFPWNRPGGS